MGAKPTWLVRHAALDVMEEARSDYVVDEVRYATMLLTGSASAIALLMSLRSRAGARL